MCSPFRDGRGSRPASSRSHGPRCASLQAAWRTLLVAVLLGLWLASCRPGGRQAESGSPAEPTGTLEPHLGPGPAAGAPQAAYDESDGAAYQGKRYYEAYNCNGCHSEGGGGMGPALMDEQWIYGERPEQIVASIVEGRPNGMPSFGRRIPEPQVWQLAAYVRSLGTSAANAGSAGRGTSSAAGSESTGGSRKR